MNPATRRLIKVMPEDMALTQQMFDLLLGDNLQGRKDHIAENGYKYLDQLDVCLLYTSNPSNASCKSSGISTMSQPAAIAATAASAEV